MLAHTYIHTYIHRSYIDIYIYIDSVLFPSDLKAQNAKVYEAAAET